MSVAACALAALALLAGAASTASAASSADAGIVSSSPLDDLMGDPSFAAEYEGGSFSRSESEADYRLVNFSEYAYDPTDPSRLSLYVYVFNPTIGRLAIDSSAVNSIGISSNVFEDGGWMKLPLRTVCSEDDGSFYKFSVVLPDLNDALPAVRHYSVSGIEIASAAESTRPIDYEVGSRFDYTGYAAGIMGRSESDLACTKQDQETVSLDVHGGVYRTASSDKGFGWNYDLFYVYFSIPRDLLDRYGDLHSLHFTYNRWKLSDLFIISGDGKGVVGMDEYYDQFLDPSKAKFFGSDLTPSGESPVTSNDLLSPGNIRWWSEKQVFKTESGVDGESYVSRESLENRFFECESSGTHLYDERENGSPSVENTITAEDEYDLPSYGETHDGWDKFWDGLLFVDFPGSLNDIPAIERLPTGSIDGDEYLISEEDLGDVKSFCAESALAGEVPYIFRFDLRDYRWEYLYRMVNTQIKTNIGIRVMQCTAVTGFDVIDVGFKNGENAITVLPVVANPIDIFPSLTDPTPDAFGLWSLIRLILGALIAVIAVVALVKAAPYLASLKASRSLSKAADKMAKSADRDKDKEA